MDKTTSTELEAAAFRRLVAHLQDRTDVQNIDMMNLAGFCRNCMSRWYREAANASGLDMNETAARAIIYGMDYACLLYTSPSPRDMRRSRMPSSA